MNSQRRPSAQLQQFQKTSLIIKRDTNQFRRPSNVNSKKSKSRSNSNNNSTRTTAATTTTKHGEPVSIALTPSSDKNGLIKVKKSNGVNTSYLSSTTNENMAAKKSFLSKTKASVYSTHTCCNFSLLYVSYFTAVYAIVSKKNFFPIKSQHEI